MPRQEIMQPTQPGREIPGLRLLVVTSLYTPDPNLAQILGEQVEWISSELRTNGILAFESGAFEAASGEPTAYTIIGCRNKQEVGNFVGSPRHQRVARTAISGSYRLRSLHLDSDGIWPGLTRELRDQVDATPPKFDLKRVA